MLQKLKLHISKNREGSLEQGTLLSIHTQPKEWSYIDCFKHNLKKYKRQYFGYINKNNEHTLFINCFWGDEIFHKNEWLKNRIMVLDGGSYYWNVKYNIEKDELFDLDVNGGG